MAAVCHFSSPSSSPGVGGSTEPMARAASPSTTVVDPHSLSWFLTRFENRDAHGREEQWNARDMMVYTGSSLRDDKNPMSCVHRLYYDSLG
jgi:hypothetical protein